MKQTPTISVVMPVYNGGVFLAEAIESIIGQTFEDFEFVIVDNNSTDGTTDTIRDYARQDSRIRTLFVNRSGIAHAINAGFRQARGHWVARADQDDISHTSRLQTQIEWIHSAGLDVCGCCYENFGSKEGKVWCATMMRTEIAQDNAYYEDVLLDDYEWPIRMRTKARFGNVPAVLLKRRCHEQQTSRRMAGSIKTDLQKYRFRYFYEIYPHTPLPDYLALARISDKQPMTSLAELRRAAQWLVELAHHPDPLLRKRMARRWKKTCERSMALGDECEAVFQKYRGQFDVADDNDGNEHL
jgi:glycosyltransferase involved in cell wall biosynthesis